MSEIKKRIPTGARVPLQTNIEPDLFQRFMNKADAQGKKRAQAVRDAIDCYTIWGDPMDFTPEQRRAARAIFDMADQEDAKNMESWQVASRGQSSPAGSDAA